MEVETETLVKRCAETESFLTSLGFKEIKVGWWKTTLSRGLYNSITYNDKELIDVYCQGAKTRQSYRLIKRYQLQEGETVKQILLRLIDFQVFRDFFNS